jgi:hypothetical protein
MNKALVANCSCSGRVGKIFSAAPTTSLTISSSVRWSADGFLDTPRDGSDAARPSQAGVAMEEGNGLGGGEATYRDHQ